jgi:hypothetical protein
MFCKIINKTTFFDIDIFVECRDQNLRHCRNVAENNCRDIFDNDNVASKQCLNNPSTDKFYCRIDSKNDI